MSDTDVAKAARAYVYAWRSDRDLTGARGVLFAAIDAEPICAPAVLDPSVGQMSTRRWSDAGVDPVAARERAYEMAYAPDSTPAERAIARDLWLALNDLGKLADEVKRTTSPQFMNEESRSLVERHAEAWARQQAAVEGKEP